jgi:metal-responsive CopG/Arc/MetJ family transcriptional regulator
MYFSRGCIVDQNPNMAMIRVALEADLIRQVDRAARRLKLSRSALVREALHQHVKQLELRRREETDRRGYERKPDRAIPSP